jgi:hypothetical protein
MKMETQLIEISRIQKAVLKGKFIAINVYMKKSRTKINIIL